MSKVSVFYSGESEIKKNHKKFKDDKFIFVDFTHPLWDVKFNPHVREKKIKWVASKSDYVILEFPEKFSVFFADAAVKVMDKCHDMCVPVGVVYRCPKENLIDTRADFYATSYEDACDDMKIIFESNWI